MAVTTAPRRTLVPTADALPAVLPTDRLLASGMPVPALRTELRRIDDLRNVGSVVFAVAQPAATMAAAVAIGHPLAWAGAFVAMGPAFARSSILAHEAAHRLLFSNRRANDLVGKWVLAYPSLIPFEIYRRSHFAHHRDEHGPDEPDRNLYEGYPITSASWRRKLRRDATGVSGWKNLAGLGRGLRGQASRPEALRIVAAQVGVLVLCTVAGHPELYLVLWLGPWLTSWRVCNRLRAVAEHGGMVRSDDRRMTTHHVDRQSPLARATIVPFHTGWHLAHHVDMGVPWRNLPALHRELVEAGWVTPALTHPTYRSLWRTLHSRPDGTEAAQTL